MPVYRPRTRLVNFRLSEDEYRLLKDTCFRSGARSVSDYARSAVLTGAPLAASPAETPDRTPICSARWERLEGSVQQLEAKLSLLIQKELVPVHG